MKPKEREVPIIFRSAGQSAVLQALQYADGDLSITDLAHRTGLALSQVHAEVERLEAAGVTRSRRVGRTRLVSLDPGSPIAGEISSLIDKLLGVETLLGEALTHVSGIVEAVVFGSWAARQHGVSGPDPADIDLLVVGNVDPDEVFNAVRPVEERLGRPVNVVTRRPDEWDSEDSAFARSVRSGPRVTVVGRRHG